LNFIQNFEEDDKMRDMDEGIWRKKIWNMEENEEP